MKQSLDTRTKLLTKNPISLMIELSIPAVLGMVVVGLYNMMDSIFVGQMVGACLLYTSPSTRDRSLSRLPSSA